MTDTSLAPMTFSDSELCSNTNMNKYKNNIFIMNNNDILEDYEYEDTIHNRRKRHSNSDVGPATNLKYFESMPAFNHTFFKTHKANNKSMDTAKMYSLKEMLTSGGGSLQSLNDLDIDEECKESPSALLSKRESVLNALREIGSRVFVKRGSQSTVKSTDVKEFIMDKNDSNDMWEFDLQICVMSARKNGDREEYEIEVTMNHETWIIYRTFAQFLEFDKNLRKEFKNAIKTNQMCIPSLPSNLKSTLFSTSNNSSVMSLILERKIYIELYLKTIVCLQNVRQWKNFMYFADIKHMHFGSSIMGKIHISDWEMGDSLDFDCNHTLQLKFSAKNIPINTHECKGCCLRISGANRSFLMNTDFVIDHYHPRFSKCLIFEYTSSNFSDNELRIDLCLDFDSQMYSSYGTISINVMYLLSNYNGYMQVPFVMDDEHEVIPPDLYCRKSKAATSAHEINKMPSNYRILKKGLSSPLVFPKHVERVEELQVPMVCVAATLYQNRKSGKVLSMLGHNYNESKAMQMPVNRAIPRALKHILYWNESLKKTVKHLLSMNTDSKEFRMGIITNCEAFINADYVCTKDNEQSVKENIAHSLLQLWKKLLDYYPNGNVSFQDIILGCICKLSNRYEWDLAHVKYWQFVKQLNVYRAYTNIQWEKIMKMYMKLFIRTLDLCLDIIESRCKTPAQFEFCKRVMHLYICILYLYVFCMCLCLFVEG